MKIYWYEGKKNIVGKRVREARKAQKPPMTQNELSIKLELRNIFINHRSICRIEAGTRFVADYELVGIAEVFDVDILWLLNIGQ
jgi:transcriptional regulator with XRE-family HTH domain